MVFLLISFSHFSMLLMWNLLVVKSQIPIVNKCIQKVLNSSAYKAVTHFPHPLFVQSNPDNYHVVNISKFTT